MVPRLPTAVPVLASTKETATRASELPLNWKDHVTPPSMVLTIGPRSPTAHPMLGSTKEIACKKLVVPLDWRAQLAPPSVVCRMAPPAKLVPPTAQPLF